ncbi:hypothetical protein [Methylobacterium sp. WL7]|uniref:hypothetical protein n=1 Tax=Methylobacterium sp. WL7 TaxID=2603900 RepID=UPI0011C7DA0E|nr:hypothetical protein [Methylobacterium sp. WL7]TXN47415.1 hypothetical protein FV233_05150 [Methylobacterium sp. WL7]
MTPVNFSDATAIVALHTASIGGEVDEAESEAERAVWLAARLGQQLRATTARCGYELARCHEVFYDELHAKDDKAEADLRILEAVPVLKRAIEDLPEDEVADIWDEYGPPEDEDDGILNDH